jgi:hypothetical protein
MSTRSHKVCDICGNTVGPSFLQHIPLSDTDLQLTVMNILDGESGDFCRTCYDGLQVFIKQRRDHELIAGSSM